MGFAVINLSKKHVGHLPPGHFQVIRSAERIAFKKAEDEGLVALVEISEDRKIGPRTLKGRYAYLLDLVGKKAEPVSIPDKEIPPEPAKVVEVKAEKTPEAKTEVAENKG